MATLWIKEHTKKPQLAGGGARELLEKAIALHAKHMNGTAPTTGPAGMRSQMEMMDLMKRALKALKGGPAGGLLG